MQTAQQIIGAGEFWRLGIGGRYFRVLFSVGEIDVRFWRQGRVVYEASAVEAGFYALPDGGFELVEIASEDAQLVKVAISDGSGGYDRYNGTVNIAVADTVVNTGVVAVPTAAALVVAANATRKGVRFLNSGATAIYLGGAGVDLANGCIKLNAGELLFESEAPGAAWYGISSGGAGTLKVQELF